MNTPRIPVQADSSSSSSDEIRPGLYAKRVATRLTSEELREIEAAAERDGKSLAEWLRELALKAARQRPADPMELVLSEVAATRYLFLNRFHSTATANAEGKYLLPDSVLKIRDQADAPKAPDRPQTACGISRSGGLKRGPEQGRTVTRPMHFPSPGRRLFRLLCWIIVGPLVLMFPTSAWLYWTLAPLQKVYLTTYLASSVGASIPHKEMTVRWVMKTAPRRKSVPTLAEDVVAEPHPKLPVNLSPKAIAEGWHGVAYSAPETVQSASLAKGLQEDVYDGESMWWLFARPTLNSLAVLLSFYLLWLLFGHRLRKNRKQEQRHGRRTKGPELLSDGWRRPFEVRGIRFQLHFAKSPWNRLPFGPSCCIPRRLESGHIELIGDTGSGKSTAIGKSFARFRSVVNPPWSTTRPWISSASSTILSAAT